MRLSDLKPLPDFVAKAFAELGEQQRGRPESAMLRLQRYIGGGVLSLVCEHDGDLIHRMTHMAPQGYFLGDYVKEKVDKTLRVLTNPYGFEREMFENFVHNADYYGKPRQEFQHHALELLWDYGLEFKKLTSYNELQWTAIQVPIALSERRWNDAIKHLKYIDSFLQQDNRTIYNIKAAEYQLDSSGQLKTYR